MKHKGTITLKTERLILRRFTIDDVEHMFNNWANNPNVTKYLTWPTHESKEITKWVIQSWVNAYINDNYYQWAIVLKETNEPIGSISAFKINEENNSIEVGYCIGEKYWNKKITSEALKEVIRFLFNKVKVNEVKACHDINNPNSGKVMLKCNMKYEKNTIEKDVEVSYYHIYKKDYR